jgi:hypothetical protein
MKLMVGSNQKVLLRRVPQGMVVPIILTISEAKTVSLP